MKYAGTAVAIFLTALLALILAGALGALTQLAGSLTPSRAALHHIPSAYLAWDIAAAHTCPGLPWTILAAIGTIESDNGQSTLPGVHTGHNHAGAEGPMQFEPATFTTVAHRHHLPGATQARPASPYDPEQAIYAAAAYLCDNGAQGGHDLPAAIFAYNHASWYVAEVLAQAQTYGGRGTTVGAVTTPTPAATEALTYAEGQLGLPYTWGGTGPAHGEAGFDCSGLTQSAYTAAGIHLPRTAAAQYATGPRIPAGQPLKPGDLVFYRHNGVVDHVGIYLGGGEMIDAARPGTHVRIESARWGGDQYAGATRPATSPAQAA